MGEVLSSSLFGLGFIIASLICYKKEKYAPSAVLKYFASYMYIKLAYNTYLVILNDYSMILFVGLALACLGDIATGINNLIEKYGFIFYYLGILLYVAEACIFTYLNYAVCSNYLIYIIAGIVISFVLIYLLILRKEKLKIQDKIAESMLLISNVVLACLSIGILLSNPTFSMILFAPGGILLGISSILFVIEQHTEYESFPLKASHIATRFIAQLLITISLLFIFYV